MGIKILYPLLRRCIYISVLKSKRDVAKTEFLKNLRDLEIYVIQRTELKKKYHSFYLIKLVDLAYNAYNNAVAAYSMTIQTETDQRHRHFLLKKSLNYIYIIQSQLGIYYDLFRYERNGLSPNEMTHFCELLNKCSNTLKDAISYYKKKEEDNGSKCNS